MSFSNLINIVLIETSHPGNIGSVARAMKTMGLKNLLLINPRKFPSGDANALSGNAIDILEKAKVYKNLKDAIKDSTFVYATSARVRTIQWPTKNAQDAAVEIVKQVSANKKISIIFGREDRGLTNEELQRCHLHLKIPSSEEYSSLNLSHAVQIISYELRNMLLGSSKNFIKADVPKSTDKDDEFLLKHIDKVLLDLNFYDQNSSRQVKARIKRLLKKARPDKLEVGILRGFLSKIQEALNK